MEQLMNWLCAIPEWLSWLIIISMGFIIYSFGFYSGILFEMDSFKKSK